MSKTLQFTLMFSLLLLLSRAVLASGENSFTTCEEDYFLTPIGTCIEWCDYPLIEYTTESGAAGCKDPCHDEAPNIYFYPYDENCYETCDILIDDPDTFYPTCDFCPENCETCSSTTTCTKCDEYFYLTSDGACLSTCDLPLMTTFDEEDNLFCKKPCEDSTSGAYYYPVDGSCRPTCDALIPTDEIYESCAPCEDNCESCSYHPMRTICEQCTAPFVLTSVRTCIPSCDPPAVFENGICREPCAMDLLYMYYYPSDGGCKSDCEVPINDPNLFYPTCDYCPENCVICSSTTTCEECAQSFILTSTGTCEFPCEPPATLENGRCKGPCTNGLFYYPSDQSCRATCSFPLIESETDPLYQFCEPCDQAECLSCPEATSFCTKCSQPYYTSPFGPCIPTCDFPMTPETDPIDGSLHCKFF